MRKFTPFIVVLLVWAVLLGLTNEFSRDLFAYHCWFDDALALPIPDRFFGLNGYIKDPAFYIIQALGTIFLPFEVFFALLILGSLLIKLFGLLRISPKPSLLDVAPYLLILSFLHEGTQIRVAIALSLALWALIYFCQGNRFKAVIILCIATSFHLSVATFFIVFLLYLAYERFGLGIFIFLGMIAGILAYTNLLNEVIMKIGNATNARYLAYSTGDVVNRQNSSGLFQYFFIFVGGLTLLVWKTFIPSLPVWRELKKIVLISGFLAVCFLQIFQFNVVIASRLADLLLLPIVLVLGASLSQLHKDGKRYFVYLVLLALLCYTGARGFITYKPMKNGTTICHPESVK